jgi:hypothetical protein
MRLLLALQRQRLKSSLRFREAEDPTPQFRANYAPSGTSTVGRQVAGKRALPLIERNFGVIARLRNDKRPWLRELGSGALETQHGFHSSKSSDFGNSGIRTCRSQPISAGGGVPQKGTFGTPEQVRKEPRPGTSAEVDFSRRPAIRSSTRHTSEKAASDQCPDPDQAGRNDVGCPPTQL